MLFKRHFLREYFINIWNGKRKTHPVRILLRLVSLLYLFAIQGRSCFYKTGILKVKKLPCPVISVGNLTLGGTGKTPVVAYIARFFSDKGLNPVVLSRGYGRSVRTPIAIVSDGKNILLNPEEAGDEPYLLAENHPSLPILVGKNRYQSGIKAIKEFNPDVLILDDGFQHLSLARDLDIVLINNSKPVVNDHIFPSGPFREPVSALQRSDVVLYTHSDESTGDGFENISVKKDGLRLKASHDFENISRMKDKKIKLPEELNKKKIAIFCGIGEPGSFRKRIEQYGGEVVYFETYPDHYVYNAEDIEFIRQRARKLKAELILTTQKDEVKIKWIAPAVPFIWVVRLKIGFVEGEQKFQEALLASVLQKNNNNKVKI